MEFKKVDDYIDKKKKKYDKIPKDVLKKVIDFGLKAYFRVNSMGGDVLLKSPYFTAYTGKFFHPDRVYDFGMYRKTKMMIKNRIQYVRKKNKYDGYYYFGLIQSQYDRYLQQKNSRGRPKKHFDFGNIVLYKYFDECNLRNNGAVAIFRITFQTDFGLSLYKPNFKTDKAELILEREPLTFKDILASNYKYQFVTDYTKWKKKKKNG